jgi:hypothetical protein
MFSLIFAEQSVPIVTKNLPRVNLCFSNKTIRLMIFACSG